jgi:hypothetical protein
MKTLLALMILTFSTLASAEFCTTAIRDQFSQYEYQSFMRSSYSHDDACFQAMTDCRAALNDAQSQGQYYNANCVFTNSAPPMPPQPPRMLMCRTDLLDFWGRTIRQFTGQGMDEYSACRQSDEFCKMELARGSSNAVSCMNRGIINDGGSYPPPRPPVIIEECRANRLDPAGMFVESYMGRAEGPRGSDVKGEACRQAINICSRELVGRQTCNIAY